LKHRIKVWLSPVDQAGTELLPILETLLPVVFERAESTVAGASRQVIFESEPAKSANGQSGPGLGLILPRSDLQAGVGDLVEAEVLFSEDAAIPFPFAGRKLRIKLPANAPALAVADGELVLASDARGSLWVKSSDQDSIQFRSGFALPSLAADGMLQQVLNADRFLELLPLLEFLRVACGDRLLAPPPLRACFMFDDPNLHWPRYGFVDYREIARRAGKGNYHVSFATVPLDGWFTHPGAARLFRDHPERLSLLVHGNEHTHHELARDYALERRRGLLRQAIRRIERVERASGCRVSRVMAAPHGACTDDMLREMPGCGFESAAISHGSLRAHNQGKSWTRSLGYLPSEVVAGCPVLPRWGMTGSTLNTILLAAYLGQPIILRGHHADLRTGTDVLDELGRMINGLGEVRWGNMTELSRMNYQLELRRDVAHIRPGGINLNVHLPVGTKQLIVEPAPGDAWVDWICSGAGPHAIRVPPGRRVEIPEGCRRVMLVAVVSSNANAANGAGGPPVWPLVRRLLVEGRDRWQGTRR